MSTDPEKMGGAVGSEPRDDVSAPPATFEPQDEVKIPKPTPSDLSTSDKSSDKDVPEKNDIEMHKLHSQTSQAETMSKARIGLIMLSLCTALFLAALDVTIITTALPVIATHYKASGADYTWIGSSYLIACAAAVPVWGKLSDIWGRKPAILLANAIFFVGSLLSGVSVSIGMLIGGRVVQGIGGGGLVILVNICISDLFSMRERGKYLGIVGGVWALASAVGPLVGGVFSEKVSWRWCFYINLPLDGAAFILLIVFLRLETPKTAFLPGMKAIDWIGVIMVVGGVIMFLLGLESGGLTHPWSSAYTLCLIIFGIVALVLFFINEWKLARYPMMPLRLFKQRTTVAAYVVCFCHGFVFVGGTYYLPLYFQTVLSATPILSGVYIFPLAVTLSLGSAATGVFIKKVGRYREPIWFGMVFITLGFGLLIDIPDDGQWAKIVIYQIIAGIGVGPNFQSPLIAIQSHLPGHDIATATATFGFVRQISTSMSVVLGGVVFQNVLAKKESVIAQALGPEVASRISGANLFASTGFVKKLPPAQKVVVDRAITSSMSKLFIFYTCVAAFGLFVSLFVQKKTLSKVHEKTKTGLEEQERVRREVKEQRAAKKAAGMPTPPGTGNKSMEV